MRISLFLNSTLSKSCVQSQEKDWFQQEQKPHSYPAYNHMRNLSYEASSSQINRSFHSRLTPTSHITQFPVFLNACNELQWLVRSKTNLTQTLDAAVKQVSSLTALLLLYLTLALVMAQAAGLVVLLSNTSSLPLGLQFMLGAVLLISATAFKIMHL